MKRALTLALLFLLLGFLGGCSGCDDANVSVTSSGKLEVNPDPITFAEVSVGSSDEVDVLMGNVDPDPLTIFEIRLEDGQGGTKEGIEIVTPLPTPFVLEQGAPLPLTVRYTPVQGATASGRLVIVSSDARFTRDEPKIVEISTGQTRPRLEVLVDSKPSNLVNFRPQPPGQRETKTVTLRNSGSAPMTIWEEPQYSGGNDFRLQISDGLSYPLVIEGWDAERAAEQPGAYELVFEVEYAPTGQGQASAEILVTSNDPSGAMEQGSGEVRAVSRLDVRANLDAACIRVDGRTRNFGQVPIGGSGLDIVTVENCGTEVLEVRSIRLSENSADDEFELDLRSLDADADGDIDESLRLRPDEDQTFLLRYTPELEGTDRGTVTIVSNDTYQPELTLDLVGRGAEGECPVADAGAYVKGLSSTPRQALSATPLDYVVLDAGASTDVDGQVVDYLWTATRWPDGAASPILRGVDGADTDLSRREFRVLVAGRYEFELKVVDNEGFESCETATIQIQATPNEQIHVELTWTNPEDPNEADEVGSDVDLHLLKMGPGNWFENPYDIYFRNPNNSGGDANGLWNPESPSLDIDDRDGGGPENIQMDDPSNCEWYAVGVHYYQQLFGTAYATLRIYVNGALVFEEINRPMTQGNQFWDVARIHWDSGQVYPVNNLYEAAPASQPGEVTPEMESSGLCTTHELYPVQ